MKLGGAVLVQYGFAIIGKIILRQSNNIHRIESRQNVDIELNVAFCLHNI